MLLACSIAIAPPALASGSKVSSPLQLARRPEKLKPGDWVWAPRISRAARSSSMSISIASWRPSTATASASAVSTISSGKDGYETPRGVFTILEKDIDHRSRTYDNAPMPYQQRLTWKGVALHAGNLPGFPASHGCVRLPLEFSKLLFKTTEMGGTVVIAGSHGEPYKRPRRRRAHPGQGRRLRRRPAAARRQAGLSAGIRELSPSGPTSIIISTGDQRVVVLRNGIEIGRAKAVVQQQTDRGAGDDPDPGARRQVRMDPGRRHQPGRRRRPRSSAPRAIEQMQLPAAFVANMRSVMTPGTTVLVTQASVGEQTTGLQTTVLASEPEGEPR